jgi:hypothetical protein
MAIPKIFGGHSSGAEPKADKSMMPAAEHQAPDADAMAALRQALAASEQGTPGLGATAVPNTTGSGHGAMGGGAQAALHAAPAGEREGAQAANETNPALDAEIAGLSEKIAPIRMFSKRITDLLKASNYFKGLADDRVLAARLKKARTPAAVAEILRQALDFSPKHNDTGAEARGADNNANNGEAKGEGHEPTTGANMPPLPAAFTSVRTRVSGIAEPEMQTKIDKSPHLNLKEVRISNTSPKSQQFLLTQGATVHLPATDPSSLQIRRVPGVEPPTLQLTINHKIENGRTIADDFFVPISLAREVTLSFQDPSTGTAAVTLDRLLARDTAIGDMRDIQAIQELLSGGMNASMEGRLLSMSDLANQSGTPALEMTRQGMADHIFGILPREARIGKDEGAISKIPVLTTTQILGSMISESKGDASVIKRYTSRLADGPYHDTVAGKLSNPSALFIVPQPDQRVAQFPSWVVDKSFKLVIKDPKTKATETVEFSKGMILPAAYIQMVDKLASSEHKKITNDSGEDSFDKQEISLENEDGSKANLRYCIKPVYTYAVFEDSTEATKPAKLVGAFYLPPDINMILTSGTGSMFSEQHGSEHVISTYVQPVSDQAIKSQQPILWQDKFNQINRASDIRAMLNTLEHGQAAGDVLQLPMAGENPTTNSSEAKGFFGKLFGGSGAANDQEKTKVAA